MPKVITKSTELSVNPRTLSQVPLPQNVLMARPTYFTVDNPINAHMLKADGSKHVIDQSLAMTQWENLARTYENLGFRVKRIDGGPGLPDMVFTANQSFPWLDSTGGKRAFLSNMADDTRHQEVPLIAQALIEEGYTVEPIAKRSPQTLFESMGDCLWLPGRRFLLGGYGIRTNPSVYEKLASSIDAPVAIFELRKPKFYHLDTCLSLLDENSALACREAFTDEGWELLNALIPNLISVEFNEADAPGFACNAHCPDGKHVILQSGCKQVERRIEEAGFKPIAVETSEFIKSGGSVFCMKLMFF